MRLILAFSALLAGSLLTGCTGGPAVDGLFNNDPDYGAAYAAHVKHWDRAIGRSANIEVVQRAFLSRGGTCDHRSDPTSLACAVDVRPRYPSIRTRRIMWSMDFEREGASRVRLRKVHLHQLGLDL